MTTPTTAPIAAPTTTRETKLAKLFGLEGENWTRHANPASVWTRFTVLPLLAAAIWSREWIGWWSLVPIALSLVFMMVNPMLFDKPRSTRHWTSKGVFGERIWLERTTVELPPQFTAQVPNVTYGLQVIGFAVLTYGLIVLGWPGLLAVVTGILIIEIAKAWFIDRMVLLFEEMKTRHARYAEWEY